MTFREFIADYYPIKDRIAAIQSDPIKMIMESDSLPCDDVKFIDGSLQKVVEVTEGVFVPVLDLLAYSESDISSMDPDLRKVYQVYMENIEYSDLDIESIMSSARRYKENLAKKETLLKDV